LTIDVARFNQLAPGGINSAFDRPYGTAAISSAHGGIAEPGNLKVEVAIRELRHIRGLNHEIKTLMRGNIYHNDNRVWEVQCEELRMATYENSFNCTCASLAENEGSDMGI